MNIDRDDEYATRYEAAPTITLDDQIATQRRLVELYEVDKDKNNYDLYRQRIETAILASLEKLAALEKPVPVEPAKSQYDKFMAGVEEKDPVERLRFFCSLAMNGQDWLDVEPFFNDVQSALKLAQSEAATFEAAYKPEAQRADKAESLNRRMVEQYRDLVVAAEKAQEAMMVWTNTYAPEMCDPEGVKKSQELLNEGGTLYYIATVSQSLSEALAKLEEA